MCQLAQKPMTLNGSFLVCQFLEGLNLPTGARVIRLL